MSYAGEVREELATLFVKKPCCRRAQLWGLLRFAAAPDGSVRFLTHSRAVAQMTSDLLSDLYHGHNAKIQENRIGSLETVAALDMLQNRDVHSTTNRDVGSTKLPTNEHAMHNDQNLENGNTTNDLPSDFVMENTSERNTLPKEEKDHHKNHAFRLTLTSLDMEQLRTSCEIPNGAILPAFVCDKCGAAFLRGVFLGCGNVTDPAHTYHLDFTLNDESTAPALCDALQLAGLAAPRRFCRKGQTVLYYKSSSDIEDLLAYLGATRSVFSLMDAKIYKEIRNDTNRRQNFDLANLSKAVSGAQAHLWAIEVLRHTGKLALLPEQLQTTARLRTTYPDLPLADLAAAHDPPLTKSGLNHRLHKLLQLAREEQTEPGVEQIPAKKREQLQKTRSSDQHQKQ